MMRSLRKKDDATGLKSRISNRGSAYLDFAVGNELIGRHRQVGGCGSLANTTGGVVLRTVAGAEEAVVIGLMRDRDTTEVGADADHDQPLIVPILDAGLIGGGILQVGQRNLLGLVDLVLGPVLDV